ncbi:MAG: hypothetical protein KAS63_09765 [Candidatus Heimdallarchaeota archaeon]|nr:hypothetical protein [Candidatus Heimdallarchaeota archaeon]MCK4955637.1 hypothetical protein [Candidatus Heimdallarchaeota archaeon]
MDNKENDIPEQYKELMRKIEAIETALGLSDIDKIVEDLEQEIEEEITEKDIQISHKPDILFKPRAYLKLAKHALSYANTSIPKKDWVEVIGLLTGQIHQGETPLEQIVVEDYWPVDQGDAISVEIVDQKIFSDIFNKKDSKHFIIGWAHSHPSYTPFLSEDDLRTHLRYQTFWNKSVAVVIDPLMISSVDYGMGVFRIDEDRKSYSELTKVIEGLSTEACFESINLFMKNQYKNI